MNNPFDINVKLTLADYGILAFCAFWGVASFVCLLKLWGAI